MPGTDEARNDGRHPAPSEPLPRRRPLTRRLHIDLLRVCSAYRPAR